MRGEADTVQLELFGEWRLFVQGQRIEVGRAKVRSALTILAVAERGLSSDELIEHLWGDRLPADPRAALRVVISRCRTALGSASTQLAATDGSFSLDAATDVASFFALTDEIPDTDIAVRVQSVGRALELWDGSRITTDDADLSELQGRLDRRREAALLRHLRDLAVLDRHEQIIELTATGVLAENQRLTEHRARALAAVGRKSDALALIHECRLAHRDLGLTVADELGRLERDILDGAVDLSPSAPRPAGPVFVGRENELRFLANVAAGETVALIGDAGLGKSALLTVVATVLTERGDIVHTVSGRANGARVMEPIADLLTAELDRAGPLSPLERSAVGLVAPDATVEPGPWTHDRSRLVEVVAEVVARITADDVLIIDDAHALDAMSAEVLVQVVGRRFSRVLVASRPTPAHPIPVTEANTLELRPLGLHAIEDWITKVLGQGALDAPTLESRTGGNALFVRLLIDAEADEHATTGTELPATIVAAVASVVGQAAPRARRILDAASVLAPVHVDVLLDVAGEAAEGLDELVELGLLSPMADGDVTVSFTHSLVAAACVQLQGPSTRLALNDAATALHVERQSSVLEYWRHAVAAELIDPGRAFATAAAAAVEYSERFAWEPARAAAEAALDVRSRTSLHQPVQRLEGIVAEAMMYAGEQGGDARLAAAVDAAIAEGDADTATHLAWRLAGRGSYALLGLDVEAMHRRIDAVMNLAADPRLRARLQSVAARALAYSPFHVTGQNLFREAAGAIDEIDDPFTRAVLLREGFQGASHPDDLALSEQLGELLGREQHHDVEVPWIVPWIRFRNALRRGDGQALTRARDDARVAVREIEALPWSPVTVSIPLQHLWLESSHRMVTGDLDEAEGLANESLVALEKLIAARGDQIGRAWATVSYGILLLSIRAQQGRLAELSTLLNPDATSIVALRAAAVAARHAAGDHDSALALLRELAADRFAAIVPDLAYTGSLWILAAPTAELLDRNAARVLYDAIAPYRDQMSFTSSTTFGPMQAALAVLAEALGDDRGAREHQAEADAVMSAFRAAARGSDT